MLAILLFIVILSGPMVEVKEHQVSFLQGVHDVPEKPAGQNIVRPVLEYDLNMVSHFVWFEDEGWVIRVFTF